MELPVQSSVQVLHGGGGQVGVHLPEVPQQGSRFLGVEPGRCRVLLPRCMGAPRQGLLIREDLGQRRLRLRLPIRILRVHA